MSENQENPTGEELTPSRATELEMLVAEKEEKLRLANSRITGLEQTVASLEGETSSLKQSGLELEQRLAEAGSALSRAVASYKELVVQSNPAVPPELITGDTTDAINNSLGAAKELVCKVRGELEAQIKMTRVPAGAPQRAPVDLSTLSAREKIQYGIGGK